MKKDNKSVEKASDEGAGTLEVRKDHCEEPTPTVRAQVLKYKYLFLFGYIVVTNSGFMQWR